MKTVHKTLMLAAALALGTPALAAGPCEVEIESNDAMQFNKATLAVLQPGLLQGPAHLGLRGLPQIGLCQRSAAAPLEPGRAVVHARVQEQAVEIIAQVVVALPHLATALAVLQVEQTRTQCIPTFPRPMHPLVQPGIQQATQHAIQ